MAIKIRFWERCKNRQYRTYSANDRFSAVGRSSSMLPITPDALTNQEPIHLCFKDTQWLCLHSYLRQLIPQIHHLLTEAIPPNLFPKGTSFHSEAVPSGSRLSCKWKHSLHIHCPGLSPFDRFQWGPAPHIFLNSSKYKPKVVKH